MNETQVIKIVDDFKMSEATTVQFEFVDDNAATTTRWELNQLALTQRTEGSN
jgi:hypothetical protein